MKTTQSCPKSQGDMLTFIILRQELQRELRCCGRPAELRKGSQRRTHDGRKNIASRDLLSPGMEA
jgi:hypothetical protein